MQTLAKATSSNAVQGSPVRDQPLFGTKTSAGALLCTTIIESVPEGKRGSDFGLL